MSAEKSFQQLIKENNEIVWAPCIYDCVSAKTAEVIGFDAVTISSFEQMHSFVGKPYMTQDEMFTSAANIIKSSKCAVLVDGEDGGGNPVEVYHNVKRYAEVGAMAISIEDIFHGSSVGVRTIGVESKGKSYKVYDHIIPAELWAANVQAAVEATKGTDCIVIARIDSKGTMNGTGPEKFRNQPGLGLDESIRRAQMGVKMGAQMTMIQNICYPGGRTEWEEICKRVPGWHCYPDIHADNGVSDVEDVDELYKLGFQVVTCHAFMKGAFKGMLEYGRHIKNDKNTIFTENDDLGYPLYQIDPFTFEDYGRECDRWIETMESLRNYKEEKH